MCYRFNSCISAVVLIGCAGQQGLHAPKPTPPLRCYTVQPDAGQGGLIPRFIVLGSNPTGFQDWLAASVKPDPSYRSVWSTQFPHVAARWHHYYQGDSIQVTWGGQGIVNGQVAIMIFALSGDSLHGRTTVVDDLVPVAPEPLVVGKRASCEAGA